MKNKLFDHSLPNTDSQNGSRKILGSDENDWAIICGWAINAYSIVTSLMALKWGGRIVCLKSEHDGPVLVELIRPKIDICEVSLEKPGDVISFIKNKFPAQDNKIIFFCDERFFEVFKEESIQPVLENTRYFIGSVTHTDALLDRFLFYQLIEDLHAGPVPQTIDSASDPWEVFPNGFFLRPRRTWKGMRKLDRVTMIRTQDELEQVVNRWRARGFDESDWCYQEILSVKPRDNVSISGWHSPDNRTYFSTRHILRHPPDVGNGDLTEIISPPAGLFDRTKIILNGMNFRGPFELEFLLDEKDGQYKPIELNPRFWMQHGLIEANSDYELIRCYLGWGCDNDVDSLNIVYPYWVYTTYAVNRVLRCDRRILPFLKNSRAVYEPSYKIAAQWIPLYFVQKLMSRNQ